MTARADRDRWLALGLLLALLALAYLLLVHPWFTRPWLALQQQLQTLHERDRHVRAQLLQAPQLQQRLRQVRQRLQGQPGFLVETSSELAAAGLVQRLEHVVAQASPGNRSCVISDRSPLPAAGSGRFTRVAVQVRLRCGTPELASVLYTLESGSPRLFVDHLEVLAQSSSQSLDASGNGLDVAFELAGYLRPAASAPPAPAPEAPADAR